MAEAVAFDLDGTLLDSREAAFAALAGIARTLGRDVSIRTMRDYRELFGQIVAQCAPEEEHAETLRSMHRLAMRTRSVAMPLFDDVVQIATEVRVDLAIITSGLRGSVPGALRDRLPPGTAILAHEDGLKEHNLTRWAQGRDVVYVTDNIHDVRHCHGCGVRSAAVGWGFDKIEDLDIAGADWLVRRPDELQTLLHDLGALEVN